MDKVIDTIKVLDSLVNKKDGHQNLESIFKDFDHILISDLMNYYLNKINVNLDNNINIDECNSILELYDYNYKVIDFEKRKNNYSIMEEANIITDDLIEKLKNTNGRSITLPININNLIDYSISHYISESNVDKVLYYILIKLVIIYNCIK